MAAHPDGILLIDKPAGRTSREVAESVGGLLAPIRRRSRGGAPRYRVGHAGTLDPLATGLLVVLCGRATRLQPYLLHQDKRYTATVRLGAGTDTLDRDGEVTATAPVPPLPADLEPVLAPLRGEIMQQPPVVSAIKRGGVSLHKLVREGRDVAPPPPRRVTIARLAVLAVRSGKAASADDPGFTGPDGRIHEIDLDVACSSGTYIRALARDLAAALGTEGHIHALRRTEAGPFTVADAVAPDDLVTREDVRSRLRPLADALPHLPSVTLDAAAADALCHGGQPDADLLGATPPEHFRLLDPLGRLVAVGRRDPDTGLPRTAAVFPPTDQPEDESCA